jgi:hypothetical protein
MRSVMPPWGWTQRDLPGRTLFVGFDYAWMWPLAALVLGTSVLWFSSFLRTLAIWGALTSVAALLALARGFRLEVSPRGFTVWRTWCWIPYRRVTLPLAARVTTAGGYGDPADRMIIERQLFSEDISLGSSATCEALCKAVRSAQERWRGAGAG